jgi:hypothetical protein
MTTTRHDNKTEHTTSKKQQNQYKMQRTSEAIENKRQTACLFAAAVPN